MVSRLLLPEWKSEIIITDYFESTQEIEDVVANIFSEYIPKSKDAVLTTRRDTVISLADKIIENCYEIMHSDTEHGLLGIFNFEGKVFYVYAPDEYDTDVSSMVREGRCITGVAVGFIYHLTKINKKDAISLYNDTYERVTQIIMSNFNSEGNEENEGN